MCVRRPILGPWPLARCLSGPNYGPSLDNVSIFPSLADGVKGYCEVVTSEGALLTILVFEVVPVASGMTPQRATLGWLVADGHAADRASLECKRRATLGLTWNQ